LTVSHAQPEPKLRHARLNEIFLRLFNGAQRTDDGFFQVAGNLAAAMRLHPFPEMGVVEMLAGIVEKARILAERALDDLLKRLALPFRAFQQIICVVDISEVMLVMVKLECFLRHMGAQSVVGVRQFGKGESHGLGSYGTISGSKGAGRNAGPQTMRRIVRPLKLPRATASGTSPSVRALDLSLDRLRAAFLTK